MRSAQATNFASYPNMTSVEVEMWTEYTAIAKSEAEIVELRGGQDAPFLICDTKQSTLNRVAHTRTVTEEELRRAVKDALVRFAGRPFQWWIFSSAIYHDLSILTSEGLMRGDDMFLMQLDLDAWALRVSMMQGLQVREVAPEHLGKFMEIVYFANYGCEPRSGQSATDKEAEAKVYVRFMKGGHTHNWRHYVYVVDEQWVASVSIRCGTDWGSSSTDFALHHLATLPSQQRRGYGKAMLHYALRTAYVLGGKRMMLEASPAGAPLYALEGFTTERRLMVFVPHPPLG